MLRLELMGELTLELDGEEAASAGEPPGAFAAGPTRP